MEWSRAEVEAIVDDYLSMLASELGGVDFNKARHRHALATRLNHRSPGSIEFKHANISAALIEAGFPYISGYKPRYNYQAMITRVIAERLQNHQTLLDLVQADADQPSIVPDVDDILAAWTKPPEQVRRRRVSSMAAPRSPRCVLNQNYLQRESMNRSLGAAGEIFVLNFERARLIHHGAEHLAHRVQHTSVVGGDGAGYDILSFDVSGEERLIEVKTTKYGEDTPFFVSSNEVLVSEQESDRYHLYRLYDFRRTPRIFGLVGAISGNCNLRASSYLAFPHMGHPEGTE